MAVGPDTTKAGGQQPVTEDTAAGEQVQMREASLDVSLSEDLRALRDHVVASFPELDVLGFRGELTLIAAPARIRELLTFCRDDPDVRCELLADLSGVHWPAGDVSEQAHETTGWPTYVTEVDSGHIEVDYILYSVTHHHRLRVRLLLPDVDPVVDTATGVYGSANFMEREVFDFLGVRFDGHPDLVRILMPDDWEGHPHRKDYPLGGVEVQYKGATVPPPDERKY